MRKSIGLIICFLCLCCWTAPARAQSGNSGTIAGVVKDPSGAAANNALVEISYPVSGFNRSIKAGSDGTFQFTNVPFNPYHLVVTLQGFAPFTQDVDVRSAIPVTVNVTLKLGTATETITVQATGADLIEADPTFHTDVDRALFDKLPLESRSSSVSSLVTLASPGAVADSNGLVHALGDHAENSFSVDGQPITDQQSKVFSNQIPIDSIDALEVISGAPPAEYGGKLSLVIKVTTRSGMGQLKPTGSVSASYGSFGTSSAGFNVAFGGKKWGDFVAVNGLQSGRFLDPPEFEVMHAKGNQQNVFDRADFQMTSADTLHINLGFTRSWFQTPNSFDAAAALQDQRAKILTYNVAPSWNHLFGATTLLNVGAWVRHDTFNYYPSGDPFADQPETLGQKRDLTNAGGRMDVSYVKGIHNLKGGFSFQNTRLTENFSLGLTDPTVNDTCLDATGAPAGDASINDPAACGGAGLFPNDASNPLASAPFIPLLGCFDLTRPTPAPADGCAGPASTLFGFRGQHDIREAALYVQDTITMGPWSINLGIRGDIYRGLQDDAQIEPRAGIAYNIKKTNTVLRISYARILESPFNENLIVASTTDPVITAAFGAAGAIRPGQRNELHAGFRQAFGKYLVVDADYLWKYTHNAYDFGGIFDTPIFFPIAWHNSKIGGPSVRVSVPNFHGFTLFTVLGSAYARFFEPQNGGLGAGTGTAVFRIDHDQKFQQTTHAQYRLPGLPVWLAFTWRYDSGLVAGEVPVATDTVTPVDLTGISADQQMQAGLFCGSTFPTLTTPLTTCAPSLYGSTRMSLPAPGTENDDHNPPRVAPRNLFDVGAGIDNLFHGDRYKWGLRLTVINISNKVALYNFLSTFSGTHFVTPRSVHAEIAFHF